MLALALSQPVQSQPENIAQLRAYSLELVNEARGEHDLPPLEAGALLDESAQGHAQDMLARGYFSHVTPERRDVMDRYREAGGEQWRLVTENIGRCVGCAAPASEADVERQHHGWMDSPEHRENILSESLSRYGFGLAIDEEGFVAVQNFSGPGRPRGLAPGEEAQALPDEELAQLAVDIVNEAREAEGLGAIGSDEDLMWVTDELVSDPSEFDMDETIDPLAVLDQEQQRGWSRLGVLAGSCGGCGTEPTDADIRFFMERWLEGERSGGLLDRETTRLGVALRADGKGRKVILAVFGAR